MVERQLVYKAASGRRDYRVLPYSPLENAICEIRQICGFHSEKNDKEELL